MTGGILDAIGNTPCVELRRIVPPGSARILVKLEGANPTGNMKDRMARHAIAAAEADGRLAPGGTLVEYTGGSTGASLALVCAAKGYRARIVTSDAFSAEKTATMRAFGAEITLVPSEGGRITAELVHAMIAEAKRISAEPNHWWFDQLNNRDSAAGYHGLGEEIWSQSGASVDAFVTSVGTAHSLNGTAEALRRHNPALRAIAAEPAESPVLSGGAKGAHRIEGIGIGFVPPHWKPDLVDGIEAATSGEAASMCRRLAREEGIFAGSSTGLNIIAALSIAQRLGAGATVATLAIDSGLRYMSTDLFREGN
jgi:cysteine synthase